ncbi:CDP-alcohol phosphatidyltransferase family protein [Candidatus Poribacteria bacterium]|nr:CDP-alcohol phosphatidyltransferase family protein [Candidatus Poribacteria bacterium]
MLSSKLGHRLDKPLAPVARWLAGLGVSPNMLTVAGAIPNVVAAVVLAYGHYRVGGVIVLMGGAFDLLDGAVARVVGKQTRFGSILDSTLDRYSDALPIFGLMLYYSGWNPPEGRMRFGDMILCAAVVLGSLLVPYVRARAESLLQRCDIGLAERAERVIIFAVGLIINADVAALWILAVLTHLTVLQRLLYVRAHLHEAPEELEHAGSKGKKLKPSNAKSNL